MNFIGKMFPKDSPLKLMKEHADLAKKSVDFLPDVLGKYFYEQDISAIAKEVDQIEHDADQIKVEIRKVYGGLRYSFFNKMDMLFVLHKEDDIIDKADDVIKLLMMNQVKNLDHLIIKNIIELTHTVVDSVSTMAESVANLTLVAESSFAQKEIDKGKADILRVERKESKSDDQSIFIGRKLYLLKEEMNAVDILFLGKVVRSLSKISDRAESVAERIRMLLRA
jgi:predicted phosphate transport protein (TIGR00153 family)